MNKEYNKLREQERRDYRTFVALVVAIIALLVLGTLTSCKGAKDIVYVPIHDTISHKEVHYEPILLHDSIEVERLREVYIKGDTVFVHDNATKKQYIEVPVYVHDTLIDYQVKEIPVEVKKVVNKRVYGLFWWVGLLSMVFGIAYAGYMIYKNHLKR